MIMRMATKPHGHALGRMACCMVTSRHRARAELNPKSRHTCIFVSHQVVVLCTRMLRNWLRNPIMLASECVQYVFMSVFVGEAGLGDADY